MTNSRSTRVGTALILLGLIVGLVGIGAWAASGSQAPRIALKSLSGKTLHLSDYRGKLVLVNFWAPWCPPCRQEMPDLEAFHEAHKDTVVLGLAVSYRSKGNVANMADMMNLTYPVAYADQQTADRFGDFRGLPTTFLISPQGRIIGHHSGVLTRTRMESYRKKYLDQPGS